MESMEEFDHIDDFLQGKLEGKALDQFKQRMEEDQEFAQMVRAQMEIKHGVLYANRMNLKRQLENLDEIHKPSSFRPWNIAASIALFMVLGYSTWQFMTPSDQEKLFLAYYEPIHQIDIPTSRGVETLDDDLLEKAFMVYQSGNYTHVERYLNEVSDEEVYKPYSDYIRGLTQIELENYEQAIRSLDRVLEAQTPIAEDALWYRGLCFIQLDQTDKAKDAFEQLKDSKYAKSVSKLLEEL